MNRPGTLSAFRFYNQGVIRLLIEPVLFFTELPAVHTTGRALGFTALCAGFYAGAGLLTGPGPQSPVVMALIYFINAAGMVLISAVTGVCTMVMINGKRQGFSLVFGLYAYASGITMLISWLPFMLWFTEPWKYWLVYTGFRQSCGLSKFRAITVLLISVPVQWCLIYSAITAVTGRV
nr:YIP1 family protein [uncultured Desulfobacter sp.]